MKIGRETDNVKWPGNRAAPRQTEVPNRTQILFSYCTGTCGLDQLKYEAIQWEPEVLSTALKQPRRGAAHPTQSGNRTTNIATADFASQAHAVFNYTQVQL